MNPKPKMDSLKRLVAARASLLLDDPFWGVPALRLKLVEDPSCDTAWVDGQNMGYNPAFVDECTAAELKFLWAHEVWHCAMGHPWRRGPRDPREWNEAADRAINPVLRNAGFKLPKGVLEELSPDHVGKSAEWIFARQPKRQGKPQDGGGTGQGGGQGQNQPSPTGQGQNQPPQPQGATPPTGQGSIPPTPTSSPVGAPSADFKDFGEVRDAPTPIKGEEGPTEADWKRIVQQAAQMARARKKGKLPAGYERAAEVAAKSIIDWRPAMRRFAQEVASADYSWSRPSTRYMAHGMYMPSLRSHEVGVVVVFLDTSGSIDKVLLDQFLGEVQGLADEVQPRKVIVASIDAQVYDVEEFERGEQITPHVRGGGGTDFRPAFRYVEKMDEPPVCVIYLTDLAGTFPKEDPGIPTLWVTANETREEVPFGELLVAA